MSITKRGYVALAAGAALAGCGSSTPLPPPAVPNPGTATVDHVSGVNQDLRLKDIVIRHGRFIPSLVSLRPGVPVLWTNDDSRTHNVTSAKGSPQHFHSGPLRPGASFGLTIIGGGDIHYSSTEHGDHMRGVISAG
jgi:plastocyanin